MVTLSRLVIVFLCSLLLSSCKSTQAVQTLEEKENVEVSDLKQYIGLYTSNSGKNLYIIAKGQELFAQLEGQPSFQIFPGVNHSFYGKSIDIELTFIIVDSIITAITAERMGRTFHFNKAI